MIYSIALSLFACIMASGGKKKRRNRQAFKYLPNPLPGPLRLPDRGQHFSCVLVRTRPSCPEPLVVAQTFHAPSLSSPCLGICCFLLKQLCLANSLSSFRIQLWCGLFQEAFLDFSRSRLYAPVAQCFPCLPWQFKALKQLSVKMQ